MARDYIPTPDGKLREWLIHLKSSVNREGTKYGLDATEVSQTEQLCDEYVAQIDATQQARLISQGQVKAKKAMIKTHQPRLRRIINKMKATKLSKGNAKSLDLMWKGEEVDQNTYTLKLKAKALVTGVQIKFPKRGIDGADIKVKIGENLLAGEWIDVGVKMQSPVIYKPEGYKQGAVLRVWIQGVAIVKDKQFGNWSNITNVMYSVPISDQSGTEKTE